MSSAIGLLVAALGALVLAGWIGDVAALRSVAPGWASMKANSALCFVLAGGSLWLLGPAAVATARRRTGVAAAAAAGGIALTTLASYLLDRDLGIDQLLLRDPQTPAALHPGRPATVTAGQFLLAAAALVLLRTTDRYAVVSWLAGVNLAAAYLAIIGHIYHAPALYALPGYGSVALHTAIGQVLLAAGLFLARPERGAMHLLLSPGAGGTVARRLLPVALLAPVVLGYPPLQAAAFGQMAPGTAMLIVVIGLVVAFAATVLLNARAVDRIDAERRAAEAQASADRRFGSLLESAPDATIVTDGAGRILMVNAQTERLFGYDRRELLRQSVEVLLPARFRERHVGHRLAFSQAPRVRSMALGRDLAGQRKDGSEFPVEVSLSPVETCDGVLIAAAIRDASERRQREAALVKARAEAEALSDRLQTLIAATPLAIVELDRDGRVVLWNPAAEAMLGWRAEEVIGRPVPSIPEDRADELGRLLQAAAAGVPLRGFATRRRRKDGTLIDVSIWNAPRHGPDGTPIGVIGIAADTTEAKRTEEQLRQSQRLQAVGQLTGGVAHEFNNLLQTIIGNLEALGERMQGEPGAAELIERLIRAASRGAQLTHQLLAFSRKQPLRPEPFQAKDELARLESLLRATIGVRYRIKVEASGAISAALADVTQFDNALLNLVLNARDAMPAGGTIRLSAQNRMLDPERARALDVAPGHYVAIEVSDTGIGMAPEVASRAVEPFFTTKEVGKGTGLGLSMVHGFAKQSGGALEISSAPGAGTTVRLLLPSVVGEAAMLDGDVPEQHRAG